MKEAKPFVIDKTVLFIEPSIEPCFDQDSYGYRPNRSASDAIAKARERFHYTFDKWMRIHYPNIPFERYADDTICHCVSKAQVEYLKEANTDLIAVATPLQAHFPWNAGSDYLVQVEVKDTAQDVVFRAMITMWVSAKK